MTPSRQLPRSSPEEQGVSSLGVLAFLDAVEKHTQGKSDFELHSLMILRHGRVIAEGWWHPYRPELPHVLFSLSKSFTATAVGLAVAEGYLSLEDPVISFFPEDLPEKASANLAVMRVRHLLSMSTGHARDTKEDVSGRADGNWARGFLSLPVEYPPGTHFVYNTGATYMLSAIVQKTTGQTLMEYLTPRLFEPLGIRGAAWESCPRGINIGGYGLSIMTEDIAKFGQLYLEKGIWEDVRGRGRILPAGWVEEATAVQIINGTKPDSDWEQGYGYQFWRCRHNVYRGDGAFGQYCIVLPEQDAVIAITGAVADMQAVLNLVWEHLLLALQTNSGVPVSVAALTEQKLLETKLSSLRLLPPPGNRGSVLAAKISGRRYVLTQNPGNSRQLTDITFVFEENSCDIMIHDRSGEQRIRCGYGEWIEGETAFTGQLSRTAVAGYWREANLFEIIFRFIETPFYDTVRCRFVDNQVSLEGQRNVSFNPPERFVMQGQAEMGR